MQRWTCSKCGFSYTTDIVLLPVRCRCGQVDTTGEIIVDEVGKPAKPKRSRGLGDTVAKITGFFGVEPCNGCTERQEALNKMFPYSPEYLAEKERNERQ